MMENDADLSTKPGDAAPHHGLIRPTAGSGSVAMLMENTVNTVALLPSSSSAVTCGAGAASVTDPPAAGTFDRHPYGAAAPQPIAYGPAAAARAAGVGKTMIYSAISAGQLRSSKIGKRRLITLDALRAWIADNEVKL
jgi:excisionase family DNA binding protein